jgi:ABC-type transport system involved in cytochrome c biogenesis permease subunit
MNQANPLIAAAFLFIFAALFRIVGWLGWEKQLSLTAWGLAGISLTIMIATLVGRMYIMQRPLVFVTNLYSSALMIGTVMLTTGLVIEFVYKNGLGLIAGTLAAASACGIAHHLSTDGKDTLGALVAVLDTNYWLASHVTTVTMGYAATYLAGLFGLAYLIWGLLFTTLSKEMHTALSRMIYGTLCFATLLSFVGTVLGGIWADQSWGRFWGWDPKENGAVLIVIWNALILHARWCGLVKQRGMAVLSIVGIMVTTWSWFGTNQLGAGLHAYGFNKSLADGCRYTWLACLVLIGLGLIPLKYWRSFSPTGQPRPEVVAVDARPQMRGKRPGKTKG